MAELWNNFCLFGGADAYMTSRTGSRYHPIEQIWKQHKGMDFSAPSGTPIHALEGGEVVHCGWKNGYGNVVTIYNPQDGSIMNYAHISGFGELKKGDVIPVGFQIGMVGSTGKSTEPHLHVDKFDAHGKVVNLEERLRTTSYE